VSGLYEAMVWVIYALAAIMMLVVVTAAVLAGIGLGFVANSLREFGEGHEGEDEGDG
jgi:hypothetical protein